MNCASAFAGVNWPSVLAATAAAFGINFIFSRKSFKLFLIDAGHFVVCCSVMGAMLGLW